jgi:hypothetical protein
VTGLGYDRLLPNTLLFIITQSFYYPTLCSLNAYRTVQDSSKNPTQGAFKTLTAMVMKRSVSQDTMLWSPLKVKRRFGGTCRPRNVAVLSTDYMAYIPEYGILSALGLYVDSISNNTDEYSRSDMAALHSNMCTHDGLCTLHFVHLGRNSPVFRKMTRRTYDSK